MIFQVAQADGRPLANARKFPRKPRPKRVAPEGGLPGPTRNCGIIGLNAKVREYFCGNLIPISLEWNVKEL